MKQDFLCVALISFAADAWTQNNLQQLTTTVATRTHDPWDLNKNIWSHTNYKTSNADKPVIDFQAIENWMVVGPETDIAISPDGTCFAYTIQNSLRRTRDTLVIQSVTGFWRQLFPDASPGFFSADSRQYIFQHKKNICFLQTGTSQPRMIEGVTFWQQPPGDRGEWLAYLLKNQEGTLVLQNLLTEKEKRFEGVAAFSFDPGGIWCTIQLNNPARELVIYNLLAAKEQHFRWVANYSFNSSGQALVIKTNEKTTTDYQTAKLTNISAGIPAGQLGAGKGMDDYYQHPVEKTRVVAGNRNVHTPTTIGKEGLVAAI